MPTYTLGNFQQLVLDRLDGNSVLYTTPELTRTINEALCVLNLYCGFLQSSIQVPGFSQANQLLYATPPGLIFPLRCQFEGRQLDRISLSQIGRQYYSWMTDTTVTRGPVAHWVPLGVSLFAIHPMDASGGQDILVTGVVEPTPLVNSGDVIQLEDEYATIIADYAAHRLPLKEGGKVFSDSSVGYQNFLRLMKSKKMWLSFKAPKYFVPAAEKVA